jgi:hypothetical protein
VLRIRATDVEAALGGLLPEREIEATVERLTAVQEELKDATEIQLQGAGAAVVGAATAARAEYLQEMDVKSSDELKDDVDGVVRRLFDGFGGSSLRPGLGLVIEDLPDPIVTGLLEAMALSDGPNALITAYLVDNAIDADLIQDVVEAAVSAYLDKKLTDNFVRWAGETSMPIATLAKTILNSGYDRRFADAVGGVGLS